jgi:glycerol-3-phosphate acyltransferase PlsY
VWLAETYAGAGAGIPAGVAAVVGHVFSPWLMGRGGKGVATAAGVFAVGAPAATAVAAAVFAIVVVATRFVSVGSVAGAAALPLAVLALGPGPRAAVATTAIGLLIAWRHRANFERMRRGTEPRVGVRETDRGDASR